MDACCTIISINTNKYSKVNCTLNRVYKIHDVSSLYPLSRAKLETSGICYTLFKVQFTLLYLLIFNEIIVQHASTKIVRASHKIPPNRGSYCMQHIIMQGETKGL